MTRTDLKKNSRVQHRRIIPRIKISNELAKELGDIATKAFRRANRSKNSEDQIEREILIDPAASLAAENAINHFLSEKAFEILPPEFRELVKPGSSLAKSIRTLVETLPEDESAPFTQMRSLHCYGDAESDGLSSAQHRLEDVWQTQLSASAVKMVLERWLSLMEELHQQAGKGRSQVFVQFGFVRALAAFWTDELRSPLGSSHGRRGLFAQFVHKAAEGIPQEFARGSRWDHAIREISEKNS
jgi:hypothetical protein